MIDDSLLPTQTVQQRPPLPSHLLSRSKEVLRPGTETEPLVEIPPRTSFPRLYISGRGIRSAPGLAEKYCHDPQEAAQGWD